MNSSITEVIFDVGSDGGPQCINVTILEDLILEGNELVTFEISSDDAVISENISLLVRDDADAAGNFQKCDDKMEVPK